MSEVRLSATYSDIGAAMTELLRTREVYEKTGISEATLRWWRHRGEGPPSFKLGKKIVVYPADALAVWISNHQAASTRGDQL
jgi:predicted DNA-binding transcriptional regulator AlpA